VIEWSHPLSAASEWETTISGIWNPSCIRVKYPRNILKVTRVVKYLPSTPKVTNLGETPLVWPKSYMEPIWNHTLVTPYSPLITGVIASIKHLLVTSNIPWLTQKYPQVCPKKTLQWSQKFQKNILYPPLGLIFRIRLQVLIYWSSDPSFFHRA